MTGELEILYQDSDCVAINKPPGILVHRSHLNPSDSENVLTQLRDQIGQWVYAAHRLDRGTSGILVFGLDRDMARHLTREFEQRRVLKEYLAVVRGWPPESLVIDRPLTPWLDRLTRPEKRATQTPQDAVTKLMTLDRCECNWSIGPYEQSRYSLVRVTPKTGRRHQIRRHLNGAAYPVIGDTRHGDHRHNHFFRDVLGCRRMLLAAVHLEIAHPAKGSRLVLTASPGPEFIRICRHLGLRIPDRDE